MSWGYSWSPYVSVAQRRANAKRHIAAKQKKGFTAQPVEIEGRKITRTFWGDSWCNHLESFSDFENRLPRGRTYVRNGSVCHLEINAGEIKALVSGSELYDVKITIHKLPDKKWSSIKTNCSGHIGSLLELLKGKLSNSVMAVVTDRKEGLFPLPQEIAMNCSCPDWATMCKHVAATLYGVGARLDEKPELLFLLRGVDHLELIAAEASSAAFLEKNEKSRSKTIDDGDLGDIFGIDLLAIESPSANRRQFKPDREDTSDPGSKSSRDHGGRSVRGSKINSGKKVDLEKRTDSRSKTGDARTRKTDSPTIVKPEANAKTAPTIRALNKTTKTGADRISKTASRNTSHSTASTSARLEAAPLYSGEHVRELRAKFEMSQSQLAALIGVSAASISNWEKEHNLRARAVEVLKPVMKLSKRQAWNQLQRK